MHYLKCVLQSFFVIILCVTGHTGQPLFETSGMSLPEAKVFVGADFKVTDPVVKLLGLTGIRIANDSLPPQDNWPKAHLTINSRDITQVAQAVQGEKDPEITWLRGANQERWDIKGLPYLSSPLSGQEILDIMLEELSQMAAVRPTQSSYTGILVLGSSLPSVFSRIQYLKSLQLDQKIPIILLTGERKLAPENNENYAQWMKLTNNQGIANVNEDNFPADEGAMMEMVMKYHQLPYTVYYAHKKPKANRATTEDTVVEWLKSSPKQGTYLAVSGQPFVGYQSLVVKRVLLQQLKEKAANYSIEAVGDSLADTLKSGHSDIVAPTKALIGLDNLARTFYELHLLRDAQTTQLIS